MDGYTRQPGGMVSRWRRRDWQHEGQVDLWWRHLLYIFANVLRLGKINNPVVRLNSKGGLLMRPVFAHLLLISAVNDNDL